MMNLEYKPKRAWQVYKSEQQQAAMQAFVDRYMDFLQKCKTERETIQYVENRLRQAGFSETGDLIVRPFRGKALFAAKRGSKSLEEGISLIAAHADSPRLDFKQRPFIEQAQVVQGKTHYYGGIRKYQWLARPLALHGVVIKENGVKVEFCVGEKDSDPVFCVEDLLPHLAQKQMDQTVREAFEGEKLNVILGHKLCLQGGEEKEEEKEGGIKKAILALLKEQYGITEEDFVTAEVEVVPAVKPRYVGFDRSLVGGYGQDDRICVFTALEALLASGNQGRCKAVIFWDKEEIGSDGATGASSRFLQYCLEDLLKDWEPKTSLGRLLLNTQALSADVSAAVDPDFQDLHEKQNAALLGYGPCFSKFTGSRGKYGASEADAEYFGLLRGLFAKHQVPWQVAELGKVDSGGGGTVALFLASWGMQVIDLGPALLAMHSPFELASCADIYATWQAYTVFFDSYTQGQDDFLKNPVEV
ncbi:MAG: aminopeptidase [Desulfovibrio sp.]|nr:aminopeptidase [Desulfovibrio sp.]